MAWIKTLADTYDAYSDLVGESINGQAVLLPLSHSTFNAQIEVTIDVDGSYIDSRKLEKGEDIVTIVPVTEDSAARSSGIAPHPLCDKLCYIAGDYTKYTGDDKEKYYEAYMEQLQDWVESDYSHPAVQAVYKYLKKKSLIQELAREKTLELDGNGRLTDHIKMQSTGQTGANVRFIVYGTTVPETWKNQKLYEIYSRYYQEKARETKLCYVTGQKETCTDKHPAKIRNSGDKAKLISGNDEEGFTYRGRFIKKDQAVSIGYEVSQKAHNALRWILQKQGYLRDGSAIVCWIANRQMSVPDMMKDSVNAYSGIDDGDFEFDFDHLEQFGSVNGNRHDTGKYFAEQFNNAVNGYAGKIKADDKVVMIALDAATTGRLSVVYYDEMGGKQYIDAILNWQKHCKWERSIKVGKTEETKQKITCECSPAPRDMALAAFGTQRSKWLEADSKLIRAIVKRLLPCITKKGMKIPSDIIKAAARRASAPESMDGSVWYNDVLRVVCAMIRFNYEKGDKTMDHFLDDNIEDRNVLFGRLLAVFDYMEQRAMFERGENGKKKEQRTTNAKRYWNAYSSRPAKTAKTIKQNLIPYEKKLSGYELGKFEAWTEDIMNHLAVNGFHNTALSEMYLPGYYLQMEYMKTEMNELYQKKEQ